MKRKIFLFLSIICLSSCAAKKNAQLANDPSLISMQVIDRNGLTETISTKERLNLFQNIDFLKPQPYQKILRVFGKNQEGKSIAKITSYHSNGQLWQYLESIDGRAHGNYREWYPNGTLRIEAEIIEGVADINEIAQSSWIFDRCAKVYNEEGNLSALIHYNKGLLSGNSTYYYPSGKVEKIAHYESHLLHGEFVVYDEEGNLIEKASYLMGKKEGVSEGFFRPDQYSFKELYLNGELVHGSYYNAQGEEISHVKEGHGEQVIYDHGAIFAKACIKNGLVDGKIEFYSKEGILQKFYTVKDEKKYGEEMIFYPQKTKNAEPKPKISMHWQDDNLHGVVKTWYESGGMESQREICSNKKNGLSFAWYETGEIMLMEEYENDILIKGSYYKKGDKIPSSKIEGGEGNATLYDKNGIFLKKIQYERGKPVLDSNS